MRHHKLLKRARVKSGFNLSKSVNDTLKKLMTITYLCVYKFDCLFVWFDGYNGENWSKNFVRHEGVVCLDVCVDVKVQKKVISVMNTAYGKVGGRLLCQGLQTVEVPIVNYSGRRWMIIRGTHKLWVTIHNNARLLMLLYIVCAQLLTLLNAWTSAALPRRILAKLVLWHLRVSVQFVGCKGRSLAPRKSDPGWPSFPKSICTEIATEFKYRGIPTT